MFERYTTRRDHLMRYVDMTVVIMELLECVKILIPTRIYDSAHIVWSAYANLDSSPQALDDFSGREQLYFRHERLSAPRHGAGVVSAYGDCKIHIIIDRRHRVDRVKRICELSSRKNRFDTV